VVLPSLFEEQIQQEERLAYELTSISADSSPEASSYFPAAVAHNPGPHGYLDLIARARAAVDMPVIASLNGTTVAGWVDYARLIEQAGATALELNIYRIAPGASVTGAEAEANCVALLKAVRSQVKFPIAVQIASSLLGVRGISPNASTMQAPTGSFCSIASINPISISFG